MLDNYPHHSYSFHYTLTQLFELHTTNNFMILSPHLIFVVFDYFVCFSWTMMFILNQGNSMICWKYSRLEVKAQTPIICFLVIMWIEDTIPWRQYPYPSFYIRPSLFSSFISLFLFIVERCSQRAWFMFSLLYCHLNIRLLLLREYLREYY